MTNDFRERAKVTPGSKASFWLDFEDEAMGRPIDLSVYTSGKICFTNCEGEKIEITLDLTTQAAKCGSVYVEMLSADTLKLDEESLDFDAIFIDSNGEPEIFPIDNVIELEKRNS